MQKKHLLYLSIIAIAKVSSADTYHYVGPNNAIGQHMDITFKVAGSLLPNTDYIPDCLTSAVSVPCATPTNMSFVSGSIAVLDTAGNNAGVSTPIPITSLLSIHTNANKLPAYWNIWTESSFVDPVTKKIDYKQAYSQQAPNGWSGMAMTFGADQYTSFSDMYGPTQQATFVFGSDLTGLTSASNWTITPDTAAPVPPTIATSSLAPGDIGNPYNAAIITKTPNGDASTVSVAGLPDGLSFDGTNIVGTPLTEGLYNITITVTDTITGLSASANLTMTVTPTLPDGVLGAPYSGTFQISGDNGNLIYTFNPLEIPPGLTVSGHTLSGTPTLAKTFVLNVIVSDTANTFSKLYNVYLTIIDPAVTPGTCSGNDAVITTFTPGRAGVSPILSRVLVNGGPGIGSLVYLTPTAVGTTYIAPAITFVPGEYIDYVGTTNGTPNCYATTMTVKPKVEIATASLPNGTVGTAYSAPISAQYGLAPYALAVSGLPTGLSFDGTNIVGTPSAAGSFPLSLTVHDVKGIVAVKTVALSVAPAPIPPISFAPLLGNGVVGTAYSATLSATGGTGGFSFSANGLPAGLSLTGNTISGTPTLAGAYTVSLSATDTAGTVSSSSTTLSIAPLPASTCNKPVSAKSFSQSKAKITAVTATSITLAGKVVITSCASVNWNGAKVFKVGDYAEVSKGYVVNGIYTATKITIN